MKTDPAFPVRNSNEFMSGLTKREYFAAMAMNGIMANLRTSPLEDLHFSNIAEDAIRIADELLKKLES